MKEELEEFETSYFVSYAVKYAWKTQLWSFVIVAFCALRAANSFTLWMAYLTLIFRAVQMASVIVKRKIVAEASFLAIVFFTSMMFFAEFASESADIVHEVIPVEGYDPTSLEYIRQNYNPCRRQNC